MDEYISKEKAIKELREVYEQEYPTASGDFDEYASHDVPNVLRNIPAADVQPVNQWISVNDRLPETPEEGLGVWYSDCCLVCDAFGWVGMAYYITDGQESWWEFADAQNKNKIDWTEVTHWQPLPEPPKDGDAE